MKILARIAVISDIHGNYDALKAVLHMTEAHGVDYFLVLGDNIGYYYDSDKVLNCLRSLPAKVISGNHERMFLEGLSSDFLRTNYRQKYGSSFEIAYSNISAKNIEWVRSLEPTARHVMYGRVFDLHHGAPWNADAYIYPDAPKSIFDACRDEDVCFTLAGHTHYPVLKRISKKQIFINPGSVGQSRDLGGYASWCEINTVTNDISLHKSSYCTEHIINSCKKFDPQNLYLQEVIKR